MFAATAQRAAMPQSARVIAISRAQTRKLSGPPPYCRSLLADPCRVHQRKKVDPRAISCRSHAAAQFGFMLLLTGTPGLSPCLAVERCAAHVPIAVSRSSRQACNARPQRAFRALVNSRRSLPRPFSLRTWCSRSGSANGGLNLDTLSRPGDQPRRQRCWQPRRWVWPGYYALARRTPLGQNLYLLRIGFEPRCGDGPPWPALAIVARRGSRIAHRALERGMALAVLATSPAAGVDALWGPRTRKRSSSRQSVGLNDIAPPPTWLPLIAFVAGAARVALAASYPRARTAILRDRRCLCSSSPPPPPPSSPHRDGHSAPA